MFALFEVSPDSIAFFAVTLVIIAAGWIVMTAVLKRWVRAELDQLSTRLYEHIQVAGDKLKAVSEAAKPVAPVPVPMAAKEVPPPASKPEPAPVAAPAPAAKAAAEDEIAPEVLAVITAAVAHFFGANVRIRQTRMVPYSAASAWAQQGRVFVQASHNLAQRAHV